MIMLNSWMKQEASPHGIIHVLYNDSDRKLIYHPETLFRLMFIIGTKQVITFVR